MFLTANHFSPLCTDDATIPSEPEASNIQNNEQATKVKLPLPIFVGGILDFDGFFNQLICSIGSKKFIFISSTINSKTQTVKPNFIK